MLSLSTKKERIKYPNMKTLSEVCKIVGLSRRVIQEYESGDNAIAITPTTKNKYGYLLYNEKEIQHLLTIKFYREAGYSKKQMKEIFDDPNLDSQQILQKVIISLEKKKKDLDNTIKIAKGMLELDISPIEMAEVLNIDCPYPLRDLVYSSVTKFSSLIDISAKFPNSTQLSMKRKMQEFMQDSIDPHSYKVQDFISEFCITLKPLISDSIFILSIINRWIINDIKHHSEKINKFDIYISEALSCYCDSHKNDSIFDKRFLYLFNAFFDAAVEKDTQQVQTILYSLYNCLKQLEILSNPLDLFKLMGNLYLDDRILEFARISLKSTEYSCAVKPHVRSDGNRQSGTRKPLSASLLA